MKPNIMRPMTRPTATAATKSTSLAASTLIAAEEVVRLVCGNDGDADYPEQYNGREAVPKVVVERF